MKPADRIVFFDLETGGLDPLRHPIIQIAALAVDGAFREIDSLEMKLQFDHAKAEPEALAANIYDAGTWMTEAIPPGRAMSLLSSFFRTYATMEKTSPRGKTYTVARLAGHNVERFDCPFLVSWYKTAGEFCPAACFEPLDTVSLARWASFIAPMQPKDHKLGSLCEWLGIEHIEAHDALADVRATVQVAKALSKRFWLGWRTATELSPDVQEVARV